MEWCALSTARSVRSSAFSERSRLSYFSRFSGISILLPMPPPFGGISTDGTRLSGHIKSARRSGPTSAKRRSRRRRSVDPYGRRARIRLGPRPIYAAPHERA